MKTKTKISNKLETLIYEMIMKENLKTFLIQVIPIIGVDKVVEIPNITISNYLTKKEQNQLVIEAAGPSDDKERNSEVLETSLKKAVMNVYIKLVKESEAKDPFSSISHPIMSDRRRYIDEELDVDFWLKDFDLDTLF